MMTESQHYTPLILVVDDDPSCLKLQASVLSSSGYRVALCSTGAEALDQIISLRPSLVMLDIQLPDMEGLEVLKIISSTQPELPVIMCTVEDSVETVVDCMKLGCADYLTKPLKPTRILNTVKTFLERSETLKKLHALQSGLACSSSPVAPAFSGLIIQSPSYLPILHYAGSLAKENCHILITGEKGTGKHLLAKAIHKASLRKGNFEIYEVVQGESVDLAIDNSFEKTSPNEEAQRLTEKTSPNEDCEGLSLAVEKARGGSIYLPEIGAFSSRCQMQLLNLLRPVGNSALDKDLPRIICATQYSLSKLVVEGNFRRDLYHHLRAHKMDLPSLREIAEDIPILLDSLIIGASARMKRKVPVYPKELIQLLKSYAFPGNILELKELIEKALEAHEKGILSIQYFENWIYEGHYAEDALLKTRVDFSKDTPLPTLKECGQLLVTQAMLRAGGNLRQAANMLGISRQALCKRLQNQVTEGERKGKSPNFDSEDKI